MKRYVERIKDTRKARDEADDRLNDYRGDTYPEDLNDEAWDAAEAHRRAWLGRD